MTTFLVERSNWLPRPPGRRKLREDTRCIGCGKRMAAGSNAYEIEVGSGPVDGWWHKRCLHGRDQLQPPRSPRTALRTPVISAKRLTKCNVCSTWLRPSDRITALAPNRWAHAGCAAQMPRS